LQRTSDASAAIQRRVSPDVMKFLFAGGVSYVVNQIALVALYEYAFSGVTHSWGTVIGGVNLALLISSAIAVEIAIVARFAINDGWTFRHRRDKSFRRRFVQSNFGSLWSPVISLACVNILTPAFGIDYLISNSIGVALGMTWNWIWSSKVVWRDNGTPVQLEGEVVPVTASGKSAS